MKEITLITPKGVKKGKVVADYKWYIEGEIVKLIEVGYDFDTQEHICKDEYNRKWRRKDGTNTWVLQEGAD